MIKTIHKIALSTFILTVIALTFLAILSIWDVFSEDVFWKAVATVVTIGGASGLIMGAAQLLKHYAFGSDDAKSDNQPPRRPE